MTSLIQHLILASFGVALIALSGGVIRLLARREVVVRYRVQATLIGLAALLLPAQFVFCELLVSARPENARVSRPVPARTGLLPGPQPRISAPVGRPAAASHPQTGQRREGRDNLAAASLAGERASFHPASGAGWGRAVWSQVTRSRLVSVAAVIYLTGVLVFLVLLSLRILGTIRLVRGSTETTDPGLLAAARSLIGPQVSVRITRQITSPACPVFPGQLVLFPACQLQGLEARQRDCILRHEAVHLRRRDWLVCWLEQWLVVSLWFHPLAWRLVATSGQLRELSCDALVVRKTRQPNTYARAMLACCRPAQARRLHLTTGFHSPVAIQRRLEMLTSANQKVSPSMLAATWMTFLTATVFAVGLHVTLLVAAPPLSAIPPQDGQPPAGQTYPDPDRDRDGDGLSDFQEVFKYLTDPDKADSDSDGQPDGDWQERREYQYTIRSVVQVMRPVTIEYLNDDFQDARILDETAEYVELEVVHYPFNKVASAISADDNWRQSAAAMEPWLRPGPSSDWTPKMRAELKRELLRDGIDVEQLNDRQIVEQVSAWLCQRGKYVDGFTTFITAWDESGKPYIPPGLDGAVERELQKSGLTIEQQWQREVLASGMFRHRTRGSCTSSAIYLNGCLKALGIPARTVLCIPVIDASDEREFELVRNLQNPAVRQHLLQSLKPLRQSWASHTFNEVFVGGHWHRLNYSRLGQGIYDRQLFGLLTHVATVNDWADANAHQTIGRRQKTEAPRDVFGFRNPYSTISLRDEVGVHSTVQLPEFQATPPHVVEKIFWTDDPELPAGIRENCRERGRFGCMARVSGVQGMQEFLEFLEQADLRVFLDPAGEAEHPGLKIGFDPGCFWIDNGKAWIYVPFGAGDRRDLVRNVPYVVRPRDTTAAKGWQLKKKLTMTRKAALPDFAGQRE